MYKLPIEIIYGQMQTQIEGDILKAVQQVGVHVDKEELIRVLQYDRNQYDEGYADGKADAMAELVRCKDCRFSAQHDPYDPMECVKWATKWGVVYTTPDGHCHKGERKDNGN